MAASKQRKLQQLISGEELGDRKPTQLLRHMQQLLGDKLGTSADANSFLRELFLQRLPSNVRMVLASADSSMDLDKLADMAEKVMEVATPTISAVSNTTDHTDHSEIKQLWEEISRLADLVASLTTQPRHHNQSQSRPCRTASPAPSLHPRTHSVGTIRNLVMLPGSARNLVVGETPRLDTNSDRCHQPFPQSPISKGYTHRNTIFGRHRFRS